MCHSVAGSANSHQQLNTGRVVRAPAGARHAQPQDPACMPGRPDLERIPARRRRVPVSLPAVTSAGFVTITKQSSARRSDEAGNCWLLTTTTRTTPYLISLSLHAPRPIPLRADTDTIEPEKYTPASLFVATSEECIVTCTPSIWEKVTCAHLRLRLCTVVVASGLPEYGLGTGAGPHLL
jgi:hypothetical protein